MRTQQDRIVDIVTLGLSWFFDQMADRSDDRFWEDCDVCSGRGYQEDRR